MRLLLTLLTLQTTNSRYLYKSQMIPTFTTSGLDASRVPTGMAISRHSTRVNPVILAGTFGSGTNEVLFFQVDRHTGGLTSFGTPNNFVHSTTISSNFIDNIQDTNIWFLATNFANGSYFLKLDIQLGSKTQLAIGNYNTNYPTTSDYQIEAAVLIRDQPSFSQYLIVEKRLADGTNYFIRLYQTSTMAFVSQLLLPSVPLAIPRTGFYLDTIKCVALSRRATLDINVLIYNYKTNPITIKETISFPAPTTSQFRWISDDVATSKMIVIVRDTGPNPDTFFAQIYSVSTSVAAVLDKTVNFNVGTGIQFDYCTIFSATTKFIATQSIFSPSRIFGAKRYDYSLSAGNEVISVTNEFEVTSGAPSEIPHSITGAPLDSHQDLIVVWSAETSPSYSNKILVYQRQCDYLTQNGNHPVCFDCFSDQKITLEGLANCMLVSSVRFFTYKTSKDTSKTDNLRNFHGVLRLENFDINTNLVPNLQTWVQTNIKMTPSLIAYTPSFVFDAVPPNWSDVVNKFIDIPFKIVLVADLLLDETVTLTFNSHSILSSSPNFMNIAQMVTTPQTMLLSTIPPPPTCTQHTQVLHSGTCKNCETDTNFAVTTGPVCSSMTDKRFFTYGITKDNSKTDDNSNFHGILTLNFFDVNTNTLTGLQVWLQSNLVLTPNLVANTPTLVFEAINSNRAPIASATIDLPFKVQLATAISATQTCLITFSSYALPSNSPKTFYIVQMVTTPQNLQLQYTSPPPPPPPPLPTTYTFVWTVKGINTVTSQTRILQALQTNEHLIEFEISNYSINTDLIRDNIAFFESDFRLEFTDPLDSGTTITQQRLDWDPRLDSGNLYFKMKAVTSQPIVNDRALAQNISINIKPSSTNQITTPLVILVFPTKPSAITTQLFPNKKLSKETEDYLNQKPNTPLTKLGASKPVQVAAFTMVALGVVGAASGFCSLGFLNIGSALIKLFIIIELLGKFLHLPIWYKGTLLEILYTLSQFADLVNVNADALVETDKKEIQSRYWTKFTVYSDHKSVLHSIPLSCVLVIAIIIFQTTIRLISNQIERCRSKNLDQQKGSQDLKTRIHGSGALAKINSFFDNFRLTIIESSFIDIIFASYYNLITDYGSNQRWLDLLGKTLSTLFIGLIFWTYLTILETASYKPWKLTVYESQLLLENLEKKSAQQSILVRSTNIVFRVKILFVLACIVMLQNQVYACTIIMLIAQLSFFAMLFISQKKHGQIFNSWMSFLNLLIIEIAITLLVLICLVLFSVQPKAIDYQNQSKEVEVSRLESIANTVLLILILASVLVQFCNVGIAIFTSCKNCIQKKKAIEQLERAKTLVRSESIRSPLKRSGTSLYVRANTIVHDGTVLENQLSVSESISASQEGTEKLGQQGEIEQLEKKLNSDDLDNIIEFWKHASVITKEKQKLISQGEVSTALLKKKSVPELMEEKRQPSKLQNFMENSTPEKPSHIPLAENKFRTKYLKKKEALNKVDQTMRRQSKWLQVSDLVQLKKFSKTNLADLEMDNYEPFKEERNQAKNIKIDEPTDLVSPGMRSKNSKKMIQPFQQSKNANSFSKKVNQLKQDSYQSISEESENEKNDGNSIHSRDSRSVAKSKVGLAQDARSISVKPNNLHQKNVARPSQFRKMQTNKGDPSNEFESAEINLMRRGSPVNIFVNQGSASPFRNKLKKKETVLKFNNEEMNDLDSRDRLRRLNTEKKPQGTPSKRSIGSSFGDDESENERKNQLEESGIIIKNLERMNTNADGYSIASKKKRKKAADTSNNDIISLHTESRADHLQGLDFSDVNSLFDPTESPNMSPINNKRRLRKDSGNLSGSISPLRMKAVINLAQQRNFTNTPPIENFDQSLFSRGSPKDSNDSSPQRVSIKSSDNRQSTNSSGHLNVNKGSDFKPKISIFGRGNDDGKKESKRKRTASEAIYASQTNDGDDSDLYQ